MDFKSAIEQGLIDKHSAQGGEKVKQNRRDKRRSGAAAKGLSKRRVQVKGSTDRLLAQGVHNKASRKTGRPSWMTAEQQEADERRKTLRSISIRKLRPIIGDSVEILYKAGIRNLLDLSETRVAPNLPPGALRSLRNYMDKSGVGRSWS